MKSLALLGATVMLVLVENVTATAASTCLSKGYLNCVDVFGNCTKNQSSCAKYCSTNSSCVFSCCYQNNCVFSSTNLCSGSNGISTNVGGSGGNGGASYSYSYSGSSAPVVAIVVPVVVGVIFIIGVSVWCCKRQRARALLNQQKLQQNNAVINNQFNQDMANQNMGMAQMNPTPYNNNTSFQPMTQQQPVSGYPVQQGQPIPVYNQMYYQQQQPQGFLQPQQQPGYPAQGQAYYQPQAQTGVVTYM